VIHINESNKVGEIPAMSSWKVNKQGDSKEKDKKILPSIKARFCRFIHFY
jgi:hypothetical protein